MNPMQEMINKLNSLMGGLTKEIFKIDCQVDENANVVLGVMFPEKGIMAYMSNEGLVDDDHHPQDCWVDICPPNMTQTSFNVRMAHVKHFGMKLEGTRHRILEAHENVGNGVEIIQLGFERILEVVETTHNKWIW